MTFIQKIRTFNIDEIDTCSQFHQQFMNSFCADFFLQIKFSPKLYAQALQNTFVQKSSS